MWTDQLGSAGSQLDLQRELGRCRDHQLVGSRISTELVDSLEATALEADVLASGATIVILDREAARLEREERAVRVEERAYKADGKLTPAERKDLNQDLNKVSRDIYNQKHDGQTRAVTPRSASN